MKYHLVQRNLPKQTAVCLSPKMLPYRVSNHTRKPVTCP